MITKQFLNELTDKRILLDEEFKSRSDLSTYDVFISYSHKDRHYASKIAQLLDKSGYTSYIDYDDSNLSQKNVSIKTVKRLAKKMDKCKALIYLHSPSASVSKWCPWELGYVSGKKQFRCLYIPLLESQDQVFQNQEYLKIYPYGDYKQVKGTKKWEFWVYDPNNNKKYTTLKKWINGKKLTNH